MLVVPAALLVLAILGAAVTGVWAAIAGTVRASRGRMARPQRGKRRWLG